MFHCQASPQVPTISALECAHARNVGALATKLGVPDLPNLLCHFLQSQLCPNNFHNPEDTPYHECLVYEGRIDIFCTQ
ncbi:hypothetical protein PISMIDRAFT_101441 [Pisolithus microcarpus 441]|uniref:Uncharacterized protein n=1 Tax=Pisolithus microcarpus 441 TaxID=765257 RepID=A0A0C9ZAK6_9AGAM|nr:hypothetical protein BKA83DRAFT_101441 [Pisolithus microcarpus]KIK22984.1 hypothetical protein PISMIDRAFT_101441 [Pisolithus microcarpus 441]